MAIKKTHSDLRWEIFKFIRGSFPPSFGKSKDQFKSTGIWQKLRETGSELWLDTGSISETKEHWTKEFSALTTNNTLLNKEIKTGWYDMLITEAARILTEYPQMSTQERKLEIAFILNAWHGLRLVHKFDAYVSVEEHTDLAYDVDLAIEYAQRYYEICPQRFIIKIPFTPAGLLAARKLSRQGISVNQTLGFSARQNYVISRIGRAAFVNVFLGRINSFIKDNGLGDGSYVGEKATLASQAVVRNLREELEIPTRQIAASLRAAEQVRDLAGVDVLTIPPKVAAKFVDMRLRESDITDRTESKYTIGINRDVDVDAIQLNTLWDIDDDLIDCVDALEKEDLDNFRAGDLVNFFKEHKCSDVLVNWSAAQNLTSSKEGKIPKLKNWYKSLKAKRIGLDSLLNLAGLNSFGADQTDMDEHIRQVLAKSDHKIALA